mmetsp:Transcript_5174/g.9841  ORF Transcript_5174/g.9841 Transcript_5174/m.9841 type:complete len:115 (-) Transcript_5174:414-758(-)|eukprot:CAMPEP_0114253582 /NCGR_PEP_ID=MMETSP0058-20121206/16472_1 /TAXON_ID=36894 /ORGANISM="Pyramimonas parkeae, CCMP726" /LENGTH=114 /DNA_ID=CAMNT_0001367643 /DNA_START=103 /DNA_END=447 /DNA_ORIENTATION=-
MNLWPVLMTMLLSLDAVQSEGRFELREEGTQSVAAGERRLMAPASDVRFMLNAAPYGYLEKYNYKLLNTNGKEYRDLTPEERRGPFTFTSYKGKYVGSQGKILYQHTRRHLLRG